jgi:hypothetical protein
MPVKALPPQGSASTNFATWAGRDIMHDVGLLFKLSKTKDPSGSFVQLSPSLTQLFLRDL